MITVTEFLEINQLLQITNQNNGKTSKQNVNSHIKIQIELFCSKK